MDIKHTLEHQWQTVHGYCSQDRAELYDLAVIVKALKPERVMEIGVCEGGWLWCMEPFFAPGASIIGIDSLENPVIRLPNLYDLMKRFNVSHEATLIEGKSQADEVFASVLKCLGGHQLDLLHIDGGHEEEVALADWELYAPLVRSGGIVAIHDIKGVGHKEQKVDKLWAKLEADSTLHTQVLSHRDKLMGIGVVRM